MPKRVATQLVHSNRRLTIAQWPMARNSRSVPKLAKRCPELLPRRDGTSAAALEGPWDKNLANIACAAPAECLQKRHPSAQNFQDGRYARLSRQLASRVHARRRYFAPHPLQWEP